MISAIVLSLFTFTNTSNLEWYLCIFIIFCMLICVNLKTFTVLGLKPLYLIRGMSYRIYLFYRIDLISLSALSFKYIENRFYRY